MKEENRQQYEGLAPQRAEIDRIDRQIIKLLEQRFDVVSEVAAYKQRKGLPILDTKREEEKLKALGELCNESKREYLEEILREMMAASRRYQADHPQRYGLLGRALGHSHSPKIHGILGGYRYGLYEREPEQLEEFFADPTWRGISVTMPYKRDVIPYCDVLSETAIACNSVNTIVRRENIQKDADDEGTDESHTTTITTYGTNTDYDGFRYVVERSGIDVHGLKTLVLGSGGVSGTVIKVMEELGADPVITISRSGENNYGNLDLHTDARIIVNTTPVGMFPKAGTAALDVRRFPQLKAVYDLIYNPLRTKLMLDAEEAGVPAFGGLPMLVAQAAKAVEIFAKEMRKDQTENEQTENEQIGEIRQGLSQQNLLGESPAVSEGIDRDTWISEACRKLQEDRENIVLIGMPGVGKTSIGKALAELADRRFVDMDDAITAFHGRTPEEIIREDGIEAFRNIETETLTRVLREGVLPDETSCSGPLTGGTSCSGPSAGATSCSGPLVVATGGGCVEREENRDLLRENGRVIWLKRSVSELPTNGRPVSQSDGVDAIFQRRQPVYRSWSDFEVDCTGVRETAIRITQL